MQNDGVMDVRQILDILDSLVLDEIHEVVVVVVVVGDDELVLLLHHDVLVGANCIYLAVVRDDDDDVLVVVALQIYKHTVLVEEVDKQTGMDGLVVVDYEDDDWEEEPVVELVLVLYLLF